MLYVKNERHGKEIHKASTNLAIEYYLLKEKAKEEPLLLFYINENAIIIGKNQNTYEEVRQEYIDKHNIEVIRRFSGGGAVYQDMGNLSFCFLQKGDTDNFRDFASFTKPVIDALHKMGATGAELIGRNDLLIDGKKFSGNAMYLSNGVMTAHGTLLFDLDLSVATHALKPKDEKLKSKGIKSVRSRITNLIPYLSPEYQTMTIFEFRTMLLKYIFNVDSLTDIPQYILTEKDWEKIDAFEKEFTGNLDWNYGKNPQFQFSNSARTGAGQIDFHFDVANNHITQVKINGDFFGLGEISEVEEKLLYLPFTKEAIEAAFSLLPLNHYFGNVTANELTTIIFNE